MPNRPNDGVLLVRYISRFMTANLGDPITAGTPPCVGLGRNPPSCLRAGDTKRLGVDALLEKFHTAWALHASLLHG